MEKETKEENIGVNEEIREDIINIEETKVEENSEVEEVENMEEEINVINEKKKVKEIDEESVKNTSRVIIWLTVIGVGLTIVAIITTLSLILMQGIIK